MTRSQALLAALRRETDRHQALVDSASDLHTVTITIKFVAGSEQIRGVSWQEERLGSPPQKNL